jgi:hypothetical protein
MKKQQVQLNVQMPCLKAQGELLRATNFIVAFVGGFGSGKTRAAVYKAIQLGFLNAPCCGYFVQPTYTIIRDTGIREFENILKELGIPYKIHSTNAIIRVADSFDILLRSGEEADKLIGTNAAWAIIDEPGKQSEEVGKNILARVRDPKAKLLQVVLTGTPEGFNWFYDWVNEPTTFVVRAKTTDNPTLPSNYVDSLKAKYTDEEIKAYINGEFVRLDGSWYKIQSEVTTPVDTLGLIKLWKLPSQVSNQLCIGVDTGGGMGKDSSAIALLDKRDKTLVATWKSNSATVDQASDVVQTLVKMYTKTYQPHYQNFDKPPSDDIPIVLVEMNGIGLPCWQDIVKRGITAIQVKTTEGSRYANLLNTKKRVEDGTLFGPEELKQETEELYVEEGKFKGPKDLSMAIGFCLTHMDGNPYRPPEKKPDKEKFNMKLGRKKIVG